MSQPTPSSSEPKISRRELPRGRAKLLALQVAVELAASLHQLQLPRGLSHLRDHLRRAGDNTALRLSEASGRTMGHRHQHLEAASAENQEVQSVLLLMRARGLEMPVSTLDQADRLGGLIYGLLRSGARRDNT